MLRGWRPSASVSLNLRLMALTFQKGLRIRGLRTESKRGNEKEEEEEWSRPTYASGLQIATSIFENPISLSSTKYSSCTDEIVRIIIIS